ncbi:MAG TPA: amino acid ABC transporter ATP-binding protein [Gemmatales bacterium]|nr:amino acid ABC transporter ATP-binding protein [Gemmatales bacterium]HMP57999.1 amino acid ABC transporter ATP-binding protein [Gemmatales bacterium]
MDIRLDGLTKRFGSRSILNGVCLDIPAGKTVILIGPSGSGKSTLLRCINGLTPFEGGTIHVGPHRLMPTAAPGAWAEVRRLVGMIFQDFQLFPHLSVLANVIEAPVRVLRLPVEQASARGRELLRQVGLEERRDDYPHQLSGGQKQRVAIARALAMSPLALLCDEITSALDPERKNDVLDVLTALKQTGLTLVMATHEIGFARHAADHVVFLADGHIVEAGPPAEVIGRPQKERTKQFLQRVLG